MEYIALIIGLVGFLVAWYAKRQQSELSERIAQVNSRVYQLRQTTQEGQEDLKQEVLKLRFELLKQKGQLYITEDMTLDEVALTHPQAMQVLAGFHIGGCMSCSVNGSQPLGQAISMNGRELGPILVALNNLVQENETVPEETLKMPNVALTF